MTLKIMIWVFPILLIAQQSAASGKDKLDDRKKWEVLRQRMERAVSRGDISREEADNKYASFRARSKGQRTERKDPVLEGHFKRLGVEDLDKLKNELLDHGILSDQLDAVLGGMLRLVHAAKTDGDNFKLNPRIDSYFKDRLGLTNSQTDHLMTIARRIVSGH